METLCLLRPTGCGTTKIGSRASTSFPPGSAIFGHRAFASDEVEQEIPKMGKLTHIRRSKMLAQGGGAIIATSRCGTPGLGIWCRKAVGQQACTNISAARPNTCFPVPKVAATRPAISLQPAGSATTLGIAPKYRSPPRLIAPSCSSGWQRGNGWPQWCRAPIDAGRAFAGISLPFLNKS